MASTQAGAPITIDVLANDHDANSDTLRVISLDAKSQRGGAGVRSVGTGPGRRDQVPYTPPAAPVRDGSDAFWYTTEDSTRSYLRLKGRVTQGSSEE
jgi:hypothetical protein